MTLPENKRKNVHMNFLKYLTLNDEDTKVGLNVLHTGHNLIHPDELYPFPKHPTNYQFQWENGRILDEFQINYIINGGGIFESASAGKKKIEPGSIIVLFPNEWHRYKPHKKTGWNEYWIGFKGSIADQLLNNKIIMPTNPVFYIGPNEKIYQCYAQVIENAKKEQPGYQILMAGYVLQIIGLTNMLLRQKDFEGKDIEEVIKKAKILLIEEIEKPISPQEVAQKLDLGYSWFRKMFKKYTGLAPGKYQMQQRIFKAKEMLSYSNKPIKEIAYDLGFESNFHFTKIFKDKTGINPGEYRRKVIGASLLIS